MGLDSPRQFCLAAILHILKVRLQTRLLVLESIDLLLSSSLQLFQVYSCLPLMFKPNTKYQKLKHLTPNTCLLIFYKWYFQFLTTTETVKKTVENTVKTL